MDGSAGQQFLLRPALGLFRRRVGEAEEKPAPRVLGHIVHGDQRGAKDQHGAELLHPPPSVEQGHIGPKA